MIEVEIPLRVRVARQEVRMHIEPIGHGMPGLCTDCPAGDAAVCPRFRRAIRTLIDHGLPPYAAGPGIWVSS